MSDLKFSAEALDAAWDLYLAGAHENDLTTVWETALDAALARDAERLARQIIEQRVAGLHGQRLIDLMLEWDDIGGGRSEGKSLDERMHLYAEELRSALLRVLIGD